SCAKPTLKKIGHESTCKFRVCRGMADENRGHRTHLPTHPRVDFIGSSALLREIRERQAGQKSSSKAIEFRGSLRLFQLQKPPKRHVREVHERDAWREYGLITLGEVKARDPLANSMPLIMWNRYHSRTRSHVANIIPGSHDYGVLAAIDIGSLSRCDKRN